MTTASCFTCPSCGDTTPFETDCLRCGVPMGLVRVVGTLVRASRATAAWTPLNGTEGVDGPRRFELLRDDGVRVRVDEPSVDLLGPGVEAAREGDRVEVFGRARVRVREDDGAGSYREREREVVLEGGDGVRLAVRRLEAVGGSSE